VRVTQAAGCCTVTGLATVALVLLGSVGSEAGQGAAVSAERRRDAIAREWRDAQSAPVPLLPGEVAWTLTLPILPSAPGAMDDERVFVPLRQDLLVALSRETGTVEWFHTIDLTTPIVIAERRIFGVSRGRIHALDAATGEALWSVEIGEAIPAPLIWDSGWLVAITETGDVLALRAADGALIWRHALGASSVHPAVPGGENALYLSLSDGRVVALGLERGELLWEARLPGTLSAPATARDRVFVGSTDNFLYAFDAESGALQWKWRNGGDVIGAAADGEMVYVASLDNVIRAVNRGNGNQRWLQSTTTRPVLAPLAFNGVVVLTGLMPAVTVLVGETGVVMGTHAPGNLVGPPLIDAAPSAFEVAIVTITTEGVVQALRPGGVIFRDTAIAPLTALPGRAVSRERITSPVADARAP
jgi:outer membrane protein assembly factor BamB